MDNNYYQDFIRPIDRINRRASRNNTLRIVLLLTALIVGLLGAGLAETFFRGL